MNLFGFEVGSLNILLVLVLLGIAISTVEGYRRGALKCLFTLVAWIVAIVLVATINPYVTSLIEDYTTIDESIEGSVEDFLRTNEKKALSISEDDDEEEVKDTTTGLLTEKGVDLPGMVLDFLTQGVVKSVDDMIENSGVYTAVAESVAHFIVKGLSFIATWIIVWVLFAIINHTLDLVSYIPIIGGANQILGAAAGAARGLLIVWFAFYVISLMCTTPIGATCISQIRSSFILTWLYENNLLLQAVISLFGKS
ncbi:MAG: CvpA family protein [Lachnospiraceae bacterium]|nr:CvpA family protein [Lachnospiraceae bacterium]